MKNLQQVKSYSIAYYFGIERIYGISKNPDTNDYIMIFHNEYFETYCGICDSKYTEKYNKWCKPCQISSLNKMTGKSTSGNGKIDNLIKEMQLKIQTSHDIVFQWIPYNQFSDIKEISRSDFATVYSATWNDGPLKYDKDKKEYTRKSNYQVALKCLHDSQNITNEFLNVV